MKRTVSSISAWSGIDAVRVDGIRLVDVAAHIAWADRRLAADEVSAARSVAVVHGAVSEGAGRLAAGPLDPLRFETAALEAGPRELVYATACWVALADGVLATAEREVLDHLGACLRLSKTRREEIETLVWQWSGPAEDWDRRYAGLITQLGVS